MRMTWFEWGGEIYAPPPEPNPIQGDACLAQAQLAQV